MANEERITIQDVLEEKSGVEIQDYYSLGQGIYDRFEEYALHTGEGYITNSFPLFNKKIDGLSEGLYIWGAESNAGKSATMMNFLWSYCKNPDNHLYALYFSLDDNINEIIPRLIAMNQQIPISVCAKPLKYQDYIARNGNSENTTAQALCDTYIDYLQKREDGIEELRNSNKEFLVVDRETVQNLDQIMEYARRVQQYVRTYDERNNIIVAIDSLADVTVDNKKFSTEREKMDYIVTSIKHFANNDIKAPVFVSYHLRKLNHNSRPSMDDLKESGRIGYEASAVFLVHNDVSKNKQAATIFLTTPESNEKFPVIEIDFAKNKKSSYKGRLYYAFNPDFSKLTELPEDVMKRFDALVYTK